MYYFKIGGMECRCETADELRAVVGQGQSKPTESTTRVGATGAARSKARPEARATKARATKARTRSKQGNPRNGEIRKLPYVEEGLNWDVVKKIAKTLGRKDIKQLRMDLKTRKDMGK